MKLTPKRFDAIFNKIQGAKIVVAGDIIVDRYVWGDVDRISQEAPVPVVGVRKETLRPGGGSNVANNLRALGARPVCVGVVGNDHAGREFKLLLKKQDIDIRGIAVDRSRPTTVKTRIIAHNQQMIRIDSEATRELSLTMENILTRMVIKNLAGARGLIISDYAKGVVTRGFIRAIVSYARKKGLFIAVDPKEKHIDAYAGVSIITPNHKEAGNATGIPIIDDATLRRAGAKLVKDLSLPACLITLGENGMALFSEKDPLVKIPTVAREVFDVTGAGDTVISVFTAAVAGGATLHEAAVIANHAAGIVIREVGTAIALPAQIRAAMFG
ncbi:MAG: hypothetical protein A2268_11070 [Candidatus Raymondbacteria bacterium RifOxyA12_full_50_37]|uniref:Carbohydrate kinase PfkB domain-containing protein n=1 Tax=Candidatus Raymondbacteria bacterium RIFOXYD12_FULL_49_13 TaxID=1817890 RepID=A0A1F7FHG6_UNCRA|nr:MAG: hypothetical protein A2268_11070 [Candidatus Raymondbacteria bacterium RifOxyA12_full_50_37]OGJ85552.1 MAG: hypothetical protein A2248_12855 [Candidatus Raymondbacteria bacterium RIFOXYA2_FULL_49_16]OGJ95055.1 MAG: hypothetical protein A2453_07555 [Candidatus Raymondbacteria bacterium RIFOXYC2_FULL_50_21]OGK04469.1 MAG: hypothetical protein A2350_05770 [Candidatus Raymondbacteria bacterium RifOxyB12_full_50_8]OGK04895.1 MAG: hypothetical protein A2487_01795 [Candidatus Raymondbacteria b